MSLLDVFDWLELTAIGTAIRESIWLFPVIESVHLLGLALLGGAVLVVDLRLLGFGFPNKTAGYVLAQARPFFLAALLTMFATGVPLFLSEAVKCYWSDAFWLKMGALAVAIGFTFGVRNRLVSREQPLTALGARSLAISSLGVWLTVAAAGRWIGFS